LGERATGGEATTPRARAAEGQTLVLVVGILVLAAVLMLGIARLGTAAVERAHARTAADAAALAGAAQGRPAAERLARRNGARLVAYRTIGADVVVTVRFGRTRVTARARALPRVGT
jgi:hypothetical protein